MNAAFENGRAKALQTIHNAKPSRDAYSVLKQTHPDRYEITDARGGVRLVIMKAGPQDAPGDSGGVGKFHRVESSGSWNGYARGQRQATGSTPQEVAETMRKMHNLPEFKK